MADPTPIKQVRNIGPKTAEWLEAIGIFTFEDLERLGAIEAYKLLVERYPHKVSMNALWGLQGALIGIPWNEISPVVKDKLKAELEESGS
ncbi:MAG: TfoX/Sxy family protein [Chloroflexi bacterium]|nr:TfoX/Sxy family protein [Chloroflexota bacterium]